MSGRPSVFVGSSAEGHRIAQAVQVLLDHAAEVTIWSQGVFGLSQGTMESLVLALETFDFAVLVLTADDLTTKRGITAPAARDNVLLEIGLFIGALGRERTYILFDRSSPPELPSDLAGVTAATFQPHASGEIEPALGAACTQIQSAIERLGTRKNPRKQTYASASLRPRNKIPTVRVFAETAASICVLGVTARSIVAQHARFYRDKLDEGCDIQFLLIGTDPDVLRVWGLQNKRGRSTKQTLDTTLSALADLFDGQPDSKAGASKIGRCKVGFTDVFLPFSLVCVDGAEREGKMVVEFHGYHTDLDELPHVVLHRGKEAEWFEFYWKQFLTAWERSTKLKKEQLERW